MQIHYLLCHVKDENYFYVVSIKYQDIFSLFDQCRCVLRNTIKEQVTQENNSRREF